MLRHFRHLRAPAFILAIVGLCAAGMAHGQTTGVTNHLDWTPGVCTAPACAALTGFRIERGAGTGTAWTTVATALPIATSADIAAAAGLTCYRVTGTTLKGDTLPSNALCVTNVPPEVPPGAPVLKTVAQTAYSVRPDYQRLLFVAFNEVGSVKLGIHCTTAIADGYAAIPLSAVKWKGSSRPQTVVARCAAS